MELLGNLMSERYHGTVPGIVRGTVKENWDDKHKGMLKVEIFLGEQGKNVTGWVPVMTNYAGNGYGFYFLPEVGQAVLVAFESGEKSCPVVIGALWDKKNVLPKETANEKNTIKRFLTKRGCEIVFDEEEGKENITVKTPAKLSVSLQDEKKQITLQDEKGENSITMDCENGNISIQAKTKITLKIGSDEAVTIEKNSVTVKSKDIKNEAQSSFSADAQNVKLAAKANVNAEGKAGVEIKASGSLKLNSSGILEAKGSMVKIN